MALPAPLKFTVGLIDQISKPLGNIQRQVNQFTQGYRQATHTMAAGAAGVFGAGFALKQAMMPAIEMDRVIGEVKSLGVADDQLQGLTKTAMQFSVEYGKSATEFVRSSYDIQSAMGAMQGNELAGVTRNSAILAAATKADTATITSYMGTMYSIFQDQADLLGKDSWSQQIAGMTAKSVEMFKTTGQGMADAFKGVGSLGQSNGVAIQEQMAVLGMLQGSMSGSEAGTRYRAFLGGVMKAQKQLGISFTDSNGKMLPMYEIMGKLQQRFGDLNTADIAQLKTAFGSDQAVMLITDLIGKTSDLQSNIQSLNGAANLDTAQRMAATMTDQWERLEQGVFAVRTAIGAALMPALVPMISSMADGAMEIIKWTEMFPNITRWVGYGALALLGLAAAGGVVTLTAGFSKQAMLTWTLATKALGLVTLAQTKIMTFLRAAVLAAHMQLSIYGVKSKLLTAAQWMQNAAIIASTAAYGAATAACSWLWGALSKGTLAALKFSAALLANPITWVVAGIVALIAGVVALIYYWDEIKAAFAPVVDYLKQGFDALGNKWNSMTAMFADTWWFEGLKNALSTLTFPFQTLFNFIHGGWKWVTSGFTDTSGFDFIYAMADEMYAVFGKVFDWFRNLLSGITDRVKGLVSWIPGLGGDKTEEPQSQAIQTSKPRLSVQQGGVAKTMANYQQRSVNYGGVSIYPVAMNNPQDFATEMEMLAP